MLAQKIKVPNLRSLSRPPPPAPPPPPSHELTRETASIKMHSTESRFVIGSSNILFGGVYVCNFQPGNFTGWGREGINASAHVS